MLEGTCSSFCGCWITPGFVCYGCLWGIGVAEAPFGWYVNFEGDFGTEPAGGGGRGWWFGIFGFRGVFCVDIGVATCDYGCGGFWGGGIRFCWFWTGGWIIFGAGAGVC